MNDLIIDHRANHDWVSVISRAQAMIAFMLQQTAPTQFASTFDKKLTFTCDPIKPII